MNNDQSIEPIFSNDGYRPNVGIILINQENKVFWAKRVGDDGWQFPQGGIHKGENIMDSMYRELEEETGFLASDVEFIARTDSWIKYDLPKQYLFDRDKNPQTLFKGQKQLWFLLRLVNKNVMPNFEMSETPEFDDWKWIDYWTALDNVVHFKQDVYKKALTELEVHLNK